MTHLNIRKVCHSVYSDVSFRGTILNPYQENPLNTLDSE